MAIFSSLLTIDWVTVMWLAIIDFILLPNPKVKSDLFFNVINPQCHKCPHTSVCCPQTGLAKCQWNTVYRHTHHSCTYQGSGNVYHRCGSLYIKWPLKLPLEPLPVFLEEFPATIPSSDVIWRNGLPIDIVSVKSSGQSGPISHRSSESE